MPMLSFPTTLAVSFPATVARDTTQSIIRHLEAHPAAIQKHLQGLNGPDLEALADAVWKRNFPLAHSLWEAATDDGLFILPGQSETVAAVIVAFEKVTKPRSPK